MAAVLKEVKIMITKKLKKRIGKDKTIVIHVPDLPEGEVEILIMKKDDTIPMTDEVLLRLPKHRVGKVLGSLRREEIYNDAR